MRPNRIAMFILLIACLSLQSFVVYRTPDVRKGIAMAYPQYQEDLEQLGDNTWYYNWGACPIGDAHCVPMSRDGSDPELPLDYSGYVLLFNEPNNPEPYGHPIPPNDAVGIYMTLTNQYPDAKWVVGNVNLFTRRWMWEFWNGCINTEGCILPTYLGWHIYVTDDSEAINLHLFLDGIHQYEYPDTVWWITEFADVNGNISNDARIVHEFESRPFIQRWAYFTNRATGAEPWYPIGWKVSLFNWNTGEPTDIGKWYIDGLNKIFIPIMEK